MIFPQLWGIGRRSPGVGPAMTSPFTFKTSLSSTLTLPALTAVACALALLLGLRLFGERMTSRASLAASRAADVEQIWGGPLLQPQPLVMWRRADAATPELSRADISSTKVQVELDVEYRRRGITEYPGYQARVAGAYQLTNPTADPIQASFSLGLPSARSSLMLTELSLTVDGREDPSHTEYAPDKITWAGRVEGGHTAIFAVKYRARGLQRFGYALSPAALKSEDARPISHFELDLLVRGAHDELDFPLGSMSPTLNETTPEGARHLVWSVDRMLSAFDVGLVLPDKSGLTAALRKFVYNAPWFYLLFAFSAVLAMSGRTSRERAIHLVGLSSAYFLYFPLTTYLVAYLPWPIAATLGTVAMSGLMIVHAARFLGGRSAAWIAVCLVLFLAVPAAAYLIPAHTGLVLVLAGFVGVALALRQLGGLAERSTVLEVPVSAAKAVAP